MKQSKKVLSILLAALLVGSIGLTGCSKDPSTSTSTGSQSSNTSDQSGSPAEIVNVKWIMAGDDQSDKDTVLANINETLNSKYGLNLDVQFEPFGTYSDKLNMMISSQEEFDLCLTTAAWVNTYLPNVSKGAYVDITDMIDTAAPELRASLPDFCFEQAKVNGRIYAIPNYQICYNSAGVQVRKDMLEKYNFSLDNVNTYEDLEPLMEQMKNGEPGYYMVSPEIDSLDLKNEYVRVDQIGSISASYQINDTAHKVSFNSDLEKAKDALFNKWWKAGYIRADKATMLDDNADHQSGKYLIYAGCNVKPGGEVDRQNKISGKPEWVQKQLQTSYISSVAVRSTMTAVSSSSKNPEAAVKMIGVSNTDVDIYNKLCFGLEGTHYNKVDGKVSIIENSGWANAAWAIGNQFNAYLTVGQQDGIWEETDKINREAEVSPISGFTFNQDPVSSEVAKISAVVEEYKNLAYFNNWEELYDEYLTKLEQAGLSKYLAEVQTQLDAWFAANK